MVNMLWGVAAVTLDGQCTAADVLAKFREVMQLEDCSAPNASSKQRVDIYRLVPITDPLSQVAEEENLVVHLPWTTIDCAAIEDTYQQLHDAEVRNERRQESIMALVEALRASEASSDPQPSEDVQRLRQENSALRKQLELSEMARRVSAQHAVGQEECHNALRQELGIVRQEVPPRRHPVRQVPMAPPALSGWEGHVTVGSGVGPIACPMSTAPSVLIPSSCLHSNSPGSAPVTPRVPQLRQLPPRVQMSAAAPSGPPSMARMAQSAFTVPAMVERIREPLNLAGTAEAPPTQACLNVGVMPANRCAPTGKVAKAGAFRIAGQR